MNFTEIREKITAFLVPIFIIGIVLGGVVGLIGKTYFWDVSRLTILIPGEKPSKVRIDIQARFLYFDADLLGFYYPVHITFPFSRTQICTGQCVFDRLPAGDASLTVFSEAKPLYAQIFIEPDTQGNLNLIPALQIVPFADKKLIDQIRAPLITEAEKRALLGSIERTNLFQGLLFLRYNRENFLYDIRTRQSMAVPIDPMPADIARGQKEGEYLFWTENGVISWDRYGRTKTEAITELKYKGCIFTWSKNQTIITRPDGKETLSGNWVPMYGADLILITDGEKVMQIQ